MPMMNIHLCFCVCTHTTAELGKNQIKLSAFGLRQYAIFCSVHCGCVRDWGAPVGADAAEPSLSQPTMHVDLANTTRQSSKVGMRSY